MAERHQPLGIALHHWDTATELTDDKIVTQAQQGDFYRFTRNAGGGGGHELKVKNFRAIAFLHPE